MMLLGASVTKGKTQDKAITDKIEQLSRALPNIHRLKQNSLTDAAISLS